MLDEREICVYKPWAVERSTIRVSKFSRRGVRVSARIEPILKRVHLGRTVRSTALWSPSIRVTHLIGPVQAISIPGEVYSRIAREPRTGPVGTVNHKQRKARQSSLDDVHFPISQDRIHGTVPVITELLSLSEGQVIRHAGRKLVIEVQRGQSPIRLPCARQRKICRAGEGTHAVGHSRVESTGIGVAQEGVQSVPDTLSLGLDLKRIVVGPTDVVDVIHYQRADERRSTPFRRESSSARRAAKVIVRI